VSSHVATEQRRRDRINESFRVLRLIVPHSEKTDKASFLGEVTAYIRKLQRLVRPPTPSQVPLASMHTRPYTVPPGRNCFSAKLLL
jgi:hypothetical protein